jgi:hypothetical protein
MSLEVTGGTFADVGEDARAPAGQDYEWSDVRIEEPTTIHQVSNPQPGLSHALRFTFKFQRFEE